MEKSIETCGRKTQCIGVLERAASSALDPAVLGVRPDQAPRRPRSADMPAQTCLHVDKVDIDLWFLSAPFLQLHSNAAETAASATKARQQQRQQLQQQQEHLPKTT